MGTLRSFLCRRVFTPYIGLIMGVLILIYKHNTPIQHMLDGTMLDVVIFPVMYTHSDIGWVIILMSAISLIAKQRDGKARKDQDKLLLGIELLLLLTAFVLSFFGASRIRYYLGFVIIVWCVFFVLYWRHIKFLVDEGKKDYYDELVGLLTVEEREEANKKEHEEKTNKIKEKENKHKEKPIKRESVIEEDFLEDHPYINKNTMVGSMWIFLNRWIFNRFWALFVGLVQFSQGMKIQNDLQTSSGLCFILLALAMVLGRSRKGLVNKPKHWISLFFEFLMVLVASFLMVTRGFYDPVPYILSACIFWVNYWSVIKNLVQDK